MISNNKRGRKGGEGEDMDYRKQIQRRKEKCWGSPAGSIKKFNVTRENVKNA